MLATGTRFFGKDPEKDLPRLAKFLDAAMKLGKVFVAINGDEDKVESLAFCKENYPDVDAFLVTPWQKFVAPLNAIVYRASLDGADRLLLASAEFPPTQRQVDSLLTHVSESTLVAGACFSEHQFHEGEVVGNGMTVPWNTFAIWNLKHLAKFGFSLVGDAPFDQKMAGEEEVTTIAFYQERADRANFRAFAKLISIHGFSQEWDKEGWDAGRLARHHAEIASKMSRPEAQLEWAGLMRPLVTHIARSSF